MICEALCRQRCHVWSGLLLKTVCINIWIEHNYVVNMVALDFACETTLLLMRFI